MNLNLGCGPNRESLNVVTLDHAGWKFIDAFAAYNPDECYDFSLGIREPDASVDMIWLGDALEHCVRWRQPFVLSECFRVMKPGARLLISVPDMAVVMPKFLEDGSYDALIWGHQDERGGGNEWGDCHKIGYTARTLFTALRTAGFMNARRIVIHGVWYELAMEATR